MIAEVGARREERKKGNEARATMMRCVRVVRVLPYHASRNQRARVTGRERKVVPVPDNVPGREGKTTRQPNKARRERKVMLGIIIITIFFFYHSRGHLV